MAATKVKPKAKKVVEPAVKAKRAADTPAAKVSAKGGAALKTRAAPKAKAKQTRAT